MTDSAKSIRDLIIDRLARLDDEQLLDLYAAVRAHVPTIPPPATSAPPPADLTGLSTKPGSTLALTWAALNRAGRPLPLRDVYALVHRENRSVTRAMVASALSRLLQAGRVGRQGEPKAGVYSPVS